MNRAIFGAALWTACMAGMSGPVAAQTPLFGDQGEPAWSRFYQYLKTRFGSSDPTDIVLAMPSAVGADWDDPSKAVRLMEMYEWGDLAPSNSWQYHRASSKRISDGYAWFLTTAYDQHIATNGTIGQAVQEAARRANEALEFRRDLYAKAIGAGDARYAAYLGTNPRPRLTKTAYLKRWHYDDEIAAAKTALDQAAGELATISGNIADPDIKMLNDAKQALANPRQQIALPTSRDTLGDPSLWERHYVSVIGGDFAGFKGRDVKQDEEISESQADSTSFDSAWHVDVGAKFLGLFDVAHASADEQKHEEHLRSNATKIVAHYKNVQLFPIKRGEWYSENVITRFRRELTPAQLDLAFGPNGLLEVIPQELIVVRGLTLSIYADSESRDYIEHHFAASGGGGFGIGWFTVGGNASYSETQSHIHTRQFTNHIDVQDLSGRPLVIGVVAKRYGTGSTRLLAPPLSASALASGLANVRASWSPSATLSAVGGTLTATQRAALEAVPGQ